MMSILCIVMAPLVGYTMRDIRYVWKDGIDSVGLSNEVELPQFRVLGHRQKATEINLTTGIDHKTKQNIHYNSLSIYLSTMISKFSFYGIFTVCHKFLHTYRDM